MRILLTNWNDRENPQAGGAEIHLHELFGRIAGWGHDVHLVASGWPGCAPWAVVDGIQVRRVGGRHSFALRGRGAVRQALRGGGQGEGTFDVVVEDINKVPLFLPLVTGLPIVAIVPHLFGTTAFAEASVPMAAAVWAAERPIPWVYRSARFTQFPRVRGTIWFAEASARTDCRHSSGGRCGPWYRPDPATPRARTPDVLVRRPIEAL